MGQLYDRAEIYDLIESEKRTESIRNDWKQFLGGREIPLIFRDSVRQVRRAEYLTILP